MRPREIARRTLRSRTHAADSSRAARQELTHTPIFFRVRATIEMHDAGNHFWPDTRKTLAGRGQRNARRRQRPLPSPTLPPRSLISLQSAPARRYGGQRKIKSLPPPHFHRCRADRQTCAAAPAVVRRQGWPPLMLTTSTKAAAGRKRRQQSVPGQLRCGAANAANAADPCLIRGV
jgi:hypothetical protein